MARPRGRPGSGVFAPPVQARLRGYWWWLNGNVTKAAITRDLEEMKAKGFGGALHHATPAARSRTATTGCRTGPTFFSPEWRELYKHALREADRLGLEMSLNIQSGWNLGGPMVTAERRRQETGLVRDAADRPGARSARRCPSRKQPRRFLSRRGRGRLIASSPLRRRGQPADRKTGSRRPCTAPSQLLRARHARRCCRTCRPSRARRTPAAADVLDLTAKLDADGMLRWDVPAGRLADPPLRLHASAITRRLDVQRRLEGLRAGCSRRRRLRRYWDAVVEPLIADAGPLAGRAQVPAHRQLGGEAINWTPTLREEFRQRAATTCCPSCRCWPAGSSTAATRATASWTTSARRWATWPSDNHYRLFKRDGARHGLQIHPESGGPHAVPIDAQRAWA